MTGPNPLGPKSILSLYLGPLCNLYEYDIIDCNEEREPEQNPMANFMYALKAPENRRQKH